MMLNASALLALSERDLCQNVDALRACLAASLPDGDQSLAPLALRYLSLPSRWDIETMRLCLDYVGVHKCEEALPAVRDIYARYDGRGPGSYVRLLALRTLAILGVREARDTLMSYFPGDTNLQRDSILFYLSTAEGKNAVGLYLQMAAMPKKQSRAAKKLLQALCLNELLFIEYYFKAQGMSPEDCIQFAPRSPLAIIVKQIVRLRGFGESCVIVRDELDFDVVCQLFELLGICEERGYLEQFLGKPFRDTHHFSSEQAESGFVLSEEWREAEQDISPLPEGTVRIYTSRPNQSGFRSAVLELYGARCALCGLDIVELLEAAHIVGKRDNGVDDPRNGLPLCCLHHKAYDAGLFSVRPTDLAVVTSENGPTLFDLKIQHATLRHLTFTPHPEVLTWRWNEWLKMHIPRKP